MNRFNSAQIPKPVICPATAGTWSCGLGYPQPWAQIQTFSQMCLENGISLSGFTYSSSSLVLLCMVLIQKSRWYFKGSWMTLYARGLGCWLQQQTLQQLSLRVCQKMFSNLFSSGKNKQPGLRRVSRTKPPEQLSHHHSEHLCAKRSLFYCVNTSYTQLISANKPFSRNAPVYVLRK